MSSLSSVKSAADALDAAKLKLSEEIKSLWPVGSLLEPVLGGVTCTIQVTGHGSYWAGTGDIHGFNIKTMKKRTFSYRAITGY